MAPVKKAKPQAAATAAAKKNEAAEEAAEQTVISGQLEKKIKKQQVREDKKRGIVFIKHLPHGFFEEQLKNYFEQFGEVTRLRLARSRRTGNSKGFAFVEFEYPEVAQVAADTMHNYLMFKKVIKASYIPPEKQRLNYFKTTVRKVKNKAGKEIWVSSKTRAIHRKVKEHNDWSDDSYQKRTARGLRKLEQLKSKFGHLDIDFSKVVIAPKTIKTGDKAAAADEEAQASSSAVTIKSGKRKTPTEIVAEAQAKQKNAKKSKKELKPADLLGNTINEDSDDEDFIPMAASEDEEFEDLEEDEAESSDEETYMLSDEDQKPVKAKKSKKSKLTSLKQPKLDRFEELLKRKAFKGGVQKLEKKTKVSKPTAAQKTTKKAKNLIQVAAAKEVAKPLKTLKKAKSLQKPLTAPKKKTRQ